MCAQRSVTGVKRGVRARSEDVPETDTAPSAVTRGHMPEDSSALVTRLATQRRRALAGHLLSPASIALIDQTAKAISELRVLKFAVDVVTSCATSDNELPLAGRHREPSTAARLEEYRDSLERQVTRLLMWRRESGTPKYPEMNTEEVFCAVVCTLAITRVEATGPRAVALDDRCIAHVAAQTYVTLFVHRPRFTVDEWKVHVRHLVNAAAAPSHFVGCGVTGAVTGALTVAFAKWSLLLSAPFAFVAISCLFASAAHGYADAAAWFTVDRELNVFFTAPYACERPDADSDAVARRCASVLSEPCNCSKCTERTAPTPSGGRAVPSAVRQQPGGGGL